RSRPDSSLPVLDIKNALLDAELLTQVEIKDVEAPEEDEIDEDFLKQQEAFIDFTQSIARDFALRRGGAGIDIKIDSVFSVHRPVRVYTTYSGEKIRLFERNKIIENGEITELVKVTSWYVIDDFYLNGNRISESEYYAILSKYTSNNSN